MSDTPQPQRLADIPRNERTLISRNYHRRTKIVTRFSIALCVLSCLVYDWDTYLGTDQHVFKGVRPAVRRTLNWMYGVEAPSPAEQTRSYTAADSMGR